MTTGWLRPDFVKAVSVLKSILAVYVSLYLILPGCLCQILTVFGCENAIHAASQIDLPLEVAPLHKSYSMVCRCDEHVDKTAEAQSAEAFEIAALTFESRIVNPPVFKLADSNARYSAGSRAPPGGAFWTLTSHSGVFLI